MAKKKNKGENFSSRLECIVSKQDVFEEEEKDFQELSSEAYERVTKKLQSMYTLRTIVPNRMQYFTVMNSDINLSDEAKVKKKISYDIKASFDEICDNSSLFEYLGITTKQLSVININEIIFDSIEIDSDVSAEKVATVVGSFENKLVNINMDNLLDISNYSITDMISALVALSLSVMDVVVIDDSSVSINYFRLIPLLILAAVKVYKKATIEIDKELYNFLYYVVTVKNVKDGIDQEELVKSYLESQAEDSGLDSEAVDEQIDKLINYKILQRDSTDNKVYLITEIRTKEIKTE